MLCGRRVVLVAALACVPATMRGAEPEAIGPQPSATGEDQGASSKVLDLSDLERAITQDVETLVSDRESLENEVAALVEEISKQEELCNVVGEALNQLQCANRKAATCGFPVDVDGQLMTETQLLSAIRQNLAKRKGFDATLVRLRQVLAQAEAEIANAAVLSNFMDAQRPATAVDVCLMRLASRRYDSLAKLSKLDQQIACEFNAQKPHPFAAVEQLSRNVNRPSRWLVSSDEVAQFMNENRTRALRPEIPPQPPAPGTPKSQGESTRPCPPAKPAQRSSNCAVPLLFGR